MSVYTRDIPEDDLRYARDISMPLRFNEECDILMDEDNEVIDQALILLTFIPVGTIRLWLDLGSALELAIFDQLDPNTELIIDTSLRNSFEANEPRIFMDKEIIFDEGTDGNTIIVIVPYRIKITSLESATRLTVIRPGQG